MKCVEHESESRVQKQAELTVSHLSFAYPGGTDIYEDITFSAKPGQIIGVTGAVRPASLRLERHFCANILIREVSVLQAES